MWVDNETVYIFKVMCHQQKVRTGSKVAGRKKKYNIIFRKRETN